jgi:hypothetical protein
VKCANTLISSSLIFVGYFTSLSNSVLSVGRMINEQLIGINLEGSGHGLIEILSRPSSGGTE